jgi:5-methylcytosine-specific restriction endonuclease McrA
VKKRPASRRSPLAGNRGNGGKWIRPEKRLRIYDRDGWRCVWCLAPVVQANTRVEVDARYDGRIRCACLDHVLPRSRGGSNGAGNLVTSCLQCNEARGDRSAIEFVASETRRAAAAGFADETAFRAVWERGRFAAVLDRVIEAMGRELPKPAQKKAA